MKKNRVSVGIAPDDLGVGDFVAVVEPKQARNAKFMVGRDPDGDPIVMMNPEQQNQGVPGVPHKVLGISWPMGRVWRVNPRGEGGWSSHPRPAKNQLHAT